MNKDDALKRIIVYLALTFGVSAIFYYLIQQGGGLEGSGEGWVAALMWTPGLAALVTTFLFQRNVRGLGWGLGQLKYYLIAYLLPIAYAGVAYGMIWAVGLGRPSLDTLGANPLVALVQLLTLNVVLAMLLALGEEIGWRGLLVPQLFRLQPFARTALISGVIWGLWHVPLIVTGGYTSGAPTWYAIACFMILVVGVSFPFAWLRLASGSIFPAVLMHGMHNVFIQSLLDKMTVNTGSTEYFTTEFGAGLAVMGIVIGLLFWRLGASLDRTAREIGHAAV